METNRRSAAVPRLGQCGAPNVHPVGKSSPVAGTANVHTPAKGILAVAAVIEIALSAQPMAGQTWRRRKDWRYDIWSRCYRCWPHHGILTGYRRPRGGYRLAREPSDISVEDILRSIGSMEDDSLLNEVVLPAWLLRDLCFGNDLTYFFVAACSSLLLMSDSLTPVREDLLHFGDLECLVRAAETAIHHLVREHLCE
jgi:hypothetical protein